MINEILTRQTLDEQTFGSGMDQLLNSSDCQRCGGLMIRDICFDVLNDAAEIEASVMKCCQCGELIDPVILKNRSQTRGNSSKNGTRRWGRPNAQMINF